MQNYDDILYLPHHRSSVRPHMSMEERAAQFSPFAALTGHSDAIRETARLTDQKIGLSEEEKLQLNEKLQLMQMTAGSGILFQFICFVPDGKKEGGTHCSITGSVRKIDEAAGRIYLHDGTVIEICQLVKIESSYFRRYGIED